MSRNYRIETIDGEEKKISKRTGKELRSYNKKVNYSYGKNLDATNNALDNLPAGTNAKYIQHTIECQKIGVGVDRSNVEDLKARFIQYLQLCADNDMKVGNMAAYCAMGITKDVAFDWEHGRSAGKEHTAFIRFVKSVIAAYRETALADGEINPILGMFWQKSFDGLNELAEYEASNMIEGVQEHMDAQQIAEKYQDLLPE